MGFSDVKGTWSGGDLIFVRKSTGGGLFRIDADTPIAIARGSQIATFSAAVTTGLSAISGFSLTNLRKDDSATKSKQCTNLVGKTSSGTLTLYRYNSSNAAAGTAGTVAWIAIGTPATT